MHQGLRYRPDIDGLRAVAVVAVVLYHAHLGGFSGGYVGVDVFFVISGFLITSIIVHEIENKTFSIAGFYERRIRRIFPALFTVILACAIAGWYVLTPADFTAFGNSARSTALFMSNVFFNRRAGYFAPAAATQPLLHTWSLSVEEQFYAIVPFAILLVYAKAWRARGIILAIAGMASLALAAYGVRQEWTSAFYLLPSRAWELMLGMTLALGLVPLTTRAIGREVLAIAGLGMIIAAVVTYSAQTPFPGFAAVLPCAGTALIIYSGTSNTPTAVQRLLSLPPVVLTGKISYSLYLWHWPILAFAEYEWTGQLGVAERAGLVAVSVGLSIVTWAFVEQPARRRSPSASRRRVFAAGLGAIAACVIMGLAIRFTDGAMKRLPPEARTFLHHYPTKVAKDVVCQLKASPKSSADMQGCTIGAQIAATPSFVLWGDSHALAIAPEFSKIAAEAGLSGYFVASGGCPPLLGLDELDRQTFGKCVGGSQAIPDLLQDPAIKTVVLFGRWALYSEGAGSPNETGVTVRRFVDADLAANRNAFGALLRRTIGDILAAGHHVVVIGPVPELPFHLQSTVIKSMMRGEKRDFSLQRAVFDQRESSILPLLDDISKMPGVRVLYPQETLCDSAICRTFNGKSPLYVDDDHLSRQGAQLLAPLMRDALKP